ncbi:ATPase family AAA domain-containing protein 2 isoform X1, partial [Ixodes scapularis]
AEAAGPTAEQLRMMAIHNALPFVGFGFLDNFIMIVAGDYIDTTIGIGLGISTMAAAGLGNAISDAAGIGSAWYVEKLAVKIGVQAPGLTPAQLEMAATRWSANIGRAVGVFVGCILGMFPLLFLSSKEDVRQRHEKPNKNIRHRAYALQDAAHALVDTELDWEFEKICQEIVQARKERGEEPVAYVPKNYHVVPRQPPRRDSDANEVAHLDAPSEDGGNKRFSRRIRGLHVSSDEEEAPKAAASGHATTDGATNSGRMPLPPRCEVSSKSTPTSQSEPSGRRAYAVVRRRKSPWFGCHSRRRIRLATTQYAPATPKHPSSTGKAARARLKRRRLSSEHTVPKETPTACTSPSSSLNTTVPLDVTLPPATEVPACSVEQAAVSSPDKAVEVGEASNHTQGTEVPRQLHLDRRRLKEIEDEVLSLTEGCSVETLERLHCSLLNA